MEGKHFSSTANSPRKLTRPHTQSQSTQLDSFKVLIMESSTSSDRNKVAIMAKQEEDASTLKRFHQMHY